MYLGVELLGHVVILCSTLGGTAKLFSTVSHQQCVKYSNFSTSLPKLVIFFFCNDSHLGGCEMISHCGFDLHFPNDK